MLPTCPWNGSSTVPDNQDFDFAQRGELFDGKCLARAILPDDPVQEIRTGQFVLGGERFWEVYLPVSR